MVFPTSSLRVAGGWGTHHPRSELSTPLTLRGNPLMFTETQHGITKSAVILASQTRVQGLASALAVWDALGR